MYRTVCRTLLVTLLVCAAPLTLGAGEATGGLTGRVLDPDGGLVARLEADVILTDTVSAKQVLGRLTKDGSYTVKNVPSGTYTLDLTVPSRIYEHFRRTNVVIEAGHPQLLDLRMAWGMNLGTVGDDPLLQGADLRAKTRNIEGSVPRTSDGRPDLSGVWTNIGDGGPPPSMPMKPWAQKMFDDLMAIKQDNPGAYCLPQVAVPSMMNYPTRFIRGEDRFVQITEDMDPGYRQIFMDGRKHPDPADWNPAWYGHSVGHWDGDTLVVDTVGFNEITWGFGIHTEKLHIIERYTRLNRGRIQVELLAEDPDAWTGPFTRKWQLGLADGVEIVEFVCAEGYPSKAMQRAPWKGRP
jgi:Protein of unknown function (DUF2012)